MFNHDCWTWQDTLMSPVYLYQGKTVRRYTIRLNEPTGARKGTVGLTTLTNSHAPTLSLMILGDSAAAGVGVTTQSQALLGQLLDQLSQRPALALKYAAIDYQLCATSGHTSFDVLTRLYAMPSTPIDIAIISVGVNDVTANVTVATWQSQIQQIITLLQRKFCAKQIVFISLPPMALMPALPYPLSQLIGKMATYLDNALQQQVHKNQGNARANVHYLSMNFDKKTITDQLFAVDGFHPSELTYHKLAVTIANYLASLPLK